MTLLVLHPSPNLIKLSLLAVLQRQFLEQILLGFIKMVTLVEECLSQRLVLLLLDQGLVNVQLAYMEEAISFCPTPYHDPPVIRLMQGEWSLPNFKAVVCMTTPITV